MHYFYLNELNDQEHEVQADPASQLLQYHALEIYQVNFLLP
ncbi:MAG: hypothetical protein N838_32450 [Thiohalocapsa sp. PB-PSB1]|nr:MAG: hypothetical protein N838_32450 [Thiohalocapsa sp. PB-PSB1]